MSAAYKIRFGPLGQELAQQLAQFSLDITGMIASYLICGIAVTGTTPKLLYKIGFANPKSSIHDVEKLGFEYEYSFGIKTRPKFQFSGFDKICHSVAYSPCHEIWISDNSCVSIFDIDGRFIRKTQFPGLSFSSGIVMDTNKQVFLVGEGLGMNLRMISCTWQGQNPQYMDFVESGWLHKLTANGQGLIYVTDNKNNQVLVFDRDLKKVAIFGKDSLKHPEDIVFLPKSQRVYVADGIQHSIMVLLMFLYLYNRFV